MIAPPTLCFPGGGDTAATAISLRGTLVLYTYVLPVDVVGGRSVGFSIGILVLKWYHLLDVFRLMSFFRNQAEIQFNIQIKVLTPGYDNDFN